MKKKYIWTDVKMPLELHDDNRGKIVDIFYKKKINHVAVIDSIADIDRGNHYHKETTQHILITKGELEYWYKNLDSSESASCVIAKVGDLITTPPLEIHALRITKANQFIVFSEGKRGGKDYETDTYRTEDIMPKMVKLHLGCGKRYLPGYIHVDIDDGDHIDYCLDIKSLKIFKNNSVDIIYSCGAIVYFDRQELKEVLLDWNRILKPGGKLRISVTDFKKIIEVYNTSGMDIETRGLLGPLFGRWLIKNDILYQKTVFDFDSLKAFLKKCGFNNISKYDWRDILPPDYDDYSKAYIPHMDMENGILISLNVEAYK